MEIKETDKFSTKCYKTGAALAALAIMLPLATLFIGIFVIIIIGIVGML